MQDDNRGQVHHRTSGRSVPYDIAQIGRNLNAGRAPARHYRARFRAEHCAASPWVFAHKDGDRILEVKNSFATACRRAGIENFRIHDLRYTCAA